MGGTGCMQHPGKTQLQVKRKQCVTSASISSAPCNIELSGNKELGLHFRVIHAWLVGVQMSAAADLREETACFCGQCGRKFNQGSGTVVAQLQSALHAPSKVDEKDLFPCPGNPFGIESSSFQRIYIDICTLSTQELYLLEFFQCWGLGMNSSPTATQEPVCRLFLEAALEQ